MLIMTRIIAGVAGSLKLASPAKTTRPTSDRIRESIFSRLEARDLIEGARVVDLYAGTGALALEAASRGAKLAWMVERDGKAAAVCVTNLKLVSKALLKEELEFDGKVINKSVATFLAAPGVGDLDLVFIDPPYEVGNDEVVENLQALKPLLKNATVVVERSSRTDEPLWPEGFNLEDTKSYGDTVTYWLSA
ncbi:MAG: 16S rRNA (guanine(966)-N(2))-methyltransferase RsmD [Micrococcales bacterium]